MYVVAYLCWPATASWLELLKEVKLLVKPADAFANGAKEAYAVGIGSYCCGKELR